MVSDVVGASVAAAAGRMKTRVLDDVQGDEVVKAVRCSVGWLLAANMPVTAAMPSLAGVYGCAPCLPNVVSGVNELRVAML